MPGQMPPDRFWPIIDDSRRDDPADRRGALADALRQSSLEDVIAFEMTYRRLLNAAYTWDLWGAVYVIHGGCSDDGFEYFRRWLVGCGQSIYETAVAKPDSLADVDPPRGPDGVWEFEGLYYVAGEVFREKGGVGDVRDHSEQEAGMSGSGPSGDPFEDDSLSHRYPRLWERFGSNPLV